MVAAGFCGEQVYGVPRYRRTGVGVMSELSSQRKKVVMVFASVACMSGGSVALKGHPGWLGAWIAVMAVTLVYGMVELAKLKKDGQ